MELRSVFFLNHFFEEIDCSLSRNRPPSVVYTGSVKMWRYLPVSKVSSDTNTAPPRKYEKTKTRKFCLSGKLAVHGCKMTGQVKTDLGECNLKVTHPNGGCSEILVSNPDNNLKNISLILHFGQNRP